MSFLKRTAVVAITLATLATLTACAPTEDAELNDCIVSVGTVYVNQYGPLDATTWDSLRTDCADQVERGEWP